MSESRAGFWFNQLVEGIAYCHSKGVVHRDIKCENLLLDRLYNIKIADFGFARLGMGPNKDGNYPYSRTFCGSYAYAPPEILTGIPYLAHRADVWSMGIVLYVMVGSTYITNFRLISYKFVYRIIVYTLLHLVCMPGHCPCVHISHRTSSVQADVRTYVRMHTQLHICTHIATQILTKTYTASHTHIHVNKNTHTVIHTHTSAHALKQSCSHK